MHQEDPHLELFLTKLTVRDVREEWEDEDLDQMEAACNARGVENSD